MPFWVSALWIGGTLALLPHLPWVTLLGYHTLCLQAATRHPRPRLGRIPRWAALPLAFLYTALGGVAARSTARWSGGLGLVILGHSLLNALSFAWLWRHLN